MRLIDIIFREGLDNSPDMAEPKSALFRKELAKVEQVKVHLLHQVTDRISGSEEFKIVFDPQHSDIRHAKRLAFFEEDELDIETALAYLGLLL